MDKTRKPGVLAVSDDLQILGMIAGIVRTDQYLDLYLAKGIADGTRIAGEKRPELVICGCRSQDECIALLRRVKSDQEASAPAFLLVCDKTPPSDIAKSLENGVDDYIERSLCSSVLLPKIKSLLRIKETQDDLKEEEQRLEEANKLLERNFKELTAVLIKTVEARIPGAGDRAESAKGAAEFVAQKLRLKDEQRKNIIFAALLHEIGKIGLPDEVVGKCYSMIPVMSRPLFQQYTAIGSMIIACITGFEEAGEAVYHQLENYDGSGFPHGLMGEEIPLGARILRAIVFEEELYGQAQSTEKVVEKMRLAIHTTLDPRIANPLIEFLLERNRKGDKGRLKISVEALQPGMVVADDVYASSGAKLIPRGVQIQEKMLAVLEERNKTDPIVGGIYIVVSG